MQGGEPQQVSSTGEFSPTQGHITRYGHQLFFMLPLPGANDVIGLLSHLPPFVVIMIVNVEAGF